ncbi:MAG: hypothetical protein ACD_73C00094G0001 [uncultured bacterium]|nr:MAG: hypothetical protein ACD_73C00094G0001 [uncultured bacterium]
MISKTTHARAGVVDLPFQMFNSISLLNKTVADSFTTYFNSSLPSALIVSFAQKILGEQLSIPASEKPLAVEIPDIQIVPSPLHQRLINLTQDLNRIHLKSENLTPSVTYAKKLALDFLKNSSLAGNVSFHDTNIPINNSPDVHIHEGAMICAFAKVKEKIDENYFDWVDRMTARGPDPRKDWFITMPYPVSMNGFTAWGLDFSRISTNDEQEVIIDGYGHPFSKNITEAILNSKIGALFANDIVQAVKVNDFLNFDWNQAPKKDSALFDTALNALDQFNVHIQSPPENPRICKPMDRLIEMKGDAKNLLAGFKEKNFDQILNSIEKARFMWSNLSLAPIEVGPLKISNLSGNLDIEYANHEISIKLKHFNTQIQLPQNFGMNLNGDISVKITLAGDRAQIKIIPDDLNIELFDHHQSITKSLFTTHISGGIDLEANIQTHDLQLSKLNIELNNLVVPQIDPVLQSKQLPFAIRGISMTGGASIDYQAGKQATKIAYAIRPTVQGYFINQSKSLFPLYTSGNLYGDIHFDHKSNTVEQATLDINDFFFDLTETISDSVSGLNGNLHFDYLPSNPVAPLKFNWDVSGAIDTQAPFPLRLVTSEFIGAIPFDIQNNYLIPQLGYAHVSLQSSLDLPAYDISAKNILFTLNGLENNNDLVAKNQYADFNLSSDEIKIRQMNFASSLTGTLGLILDGLRPVAEWNGKLEVTGDKNTPLQLKAPLLINFDQYGYEAVFHLGDALSFDTIKAKGELIAEIQGSFLKTNLETSKTPLWFDSLSIQTPTPFVITKDKKTLADKISIKANWIPENEKGNQIRLNGIIANKYATQVRLTPNRNPDKFNFSWFVKAPKMGLENETISDIKYSGYTSFDPAELLASPKLWIHSKLNALLDGSVSGPVEAFITGSIGYDKEKHSLVLNLPKRNVARSEVHVGPLKIRDKNKLLEARSNLGGTLTYQNNTLRAYKIALDKGVVDLLTPEEKQPLLSELEIGADAILGLLNGVLYCGGDQGCYVKTKIHIGDTKRLDIDVPQVRTVKTFVDSVPVSKKFFSRWLKTRLSDIQKWEGATIDNSH